MLGSLRARVTAVGDWAVGRRGPERAVIASLALAYVLPFALALVALAMLASCAQTLVWLLALAGPLVAPLAVDPRRRRAVLRWWLIPLTAAVALLAATALAALVVIRVAELTHAADAYLGMLLAGSTAPLLAAALAIRRLPPPPPRPRALPTPSQRQPASPPDQARHPPGRCRLMPPQQPPPARRSLVPAARPRTGAPVPPDGDPPRHGPRPGLARSTNSQPLRGDLDRNRALPWTGGAPSPWSGTGRTAPAAAPPPAPAPPV